jgi:two-component system, OmpR family, phosphate regulon sensor histidine kinase PhoR
VDPLVLAFVSLLVIAFALALSVALARGRELDRLTEAAEVSNADALERRLRELIDGTAEAEFLQRRVASDMRYLGDLVGVGVIRLDDGGRVDFANAAAHVLLGLNAGALLGRSVLEAFVDVRVEEIADAARQYGGSAGEVGLRGTDGRVLIVRGRRSPTQGTWLVLEDVTELRRLQQIRAEFIDNLSHELRTPLTTVSLLAETLAREADTATDPLPGKMRDRIGKIEVETGHLVQMVNELLDLTRIESGGPIEMLDDVDMGRLASASIERLRLFAERQNVTLSVDPEPNLPTIRGSEERLGQVLVNLLHNAVKFSPAGGPVTIRVRRVDGMVETAVADRGIGIPASVQARIFERFYKADRARVRGGGTGLGLAIARHIAEAHGGRLRVESHEGAGSTFFVELPIERAQDAPDDNIRIESERSGAKGGSAANARSQVRVEPPESNTSTAGAA